MTAIREYKKTVFLAIVLLLLYAKALCPRLLLLKNNSSDIICEVDEQGISGMKIGIITYWKSTNNYGEQLQNYALQQCLRDLGHEPFLIRYDYEADTIYGTKPLPVRLLRACNPKRMYRYFKSRRNNRLYLKNCADHPRGFEEFREKHLSMSRVYSSVDELRNAPPEADMYITGSDQVWNTFEGTLSEMRNRLSAFFLDFGKEELKRISYAASWGRNNVPEDEKTVISPLLEKFDAVSVREKTGVDVCRQIGRDDARQAFDPVFLHDAEMYRKLYRSDGFKAPEDKYLLFYYMNNDGKYDRKAVFDYARSQGLKVVYVTDDWHEDFERSFPRVTEWIGLIDNAECVITNSFHCVVFSLIFQKKFGVIKRFGSYKGMNTRMDSLFETVGISPRYIDDSGFEVLKRQPDRPDIRSIKFIQRPEDVINAALKKP